MKIYAGIGSRSTPSAVLAVMQKLGKVFAEDGWLLRSGNCCGADQAFQCGANMVNSKQVELFLPWQGYERSSLLAGNVVHTPRRQAYDLAARYHPAWRKCGQAARAMHARNVHIVLGADLQSQVEMVVCWTKKGQMIGGTAMAMRIAQAYGIPIKNLAVDSKTAFVMLAEEQARQAEFSW